MEFTFNLVYEAWKIAILMFEFKVKKPGSFSEPGLVIKNLTYIRTYYHRSEPDG